MKLLSLHWSSFMAWALTLGVAGVLSVGTAHAQLPGAAVDGKTGCALSGLPSLDQLSVAWTGACVDAKASGSGDVFGFSHGEIRYVLSGQFVDGQLRQQTALVLCPSDSCTQKMSHLLARDQVAAPNRTVVPVTVDSPERKPFATPAPVPVPAASPTQTEVRAPDALYRGSMRVDPQTGQITGEVTAVFTDGRRFVGHLEAGKKVGQGTYTWADGSTYSGLWANDVQEGAGEWQSAQGDRYVGNYHLGRREGKGIMTLADKTQYDGDWVADQQVGRGVLTFPNGDRYEGEFVAGQRSGRGTLVQKNGDRYTGQWLNNRRQGTGTAEWAIGQRYQGGWQDDRREGQGLMRFADGSSAEGRWHNDEAVGQVSLKFASGDRYLGEVLHGIPHGHGVYIWGSGDRFDGEMANGQPTERGTMTFQTDEATVAPPEREAAAEAPVETASAPVAVSKATLCSRAYNAARNLTALKRFLEAYPDDECGRHALAKQKIAVLEKADKKPAKEQDPRLEQARALIGLVVAYRQSYASCASESSGSCEKAGYALDVKAKIKDVDLGRQSVQVQVQEAKLATDEHSAAAVAALEAFRSKFVGKLQWKSKEELGLAF